VVIDTCKLEGYLARGPERLKLATHVLLDDMKAFIFLLVRAEVLLVDLVNEDFICNSRLDIVCSDDQLTEPSTRVLVVLSLSINDVDQSAAVTDQLCLIRLERVISREVHHRELNVRVVIDLLSFNLSSRK